MEIIRSRSPYQLTIIRTEPSVCFAKYWTRLHSFPDHRTSAFPGIAWPLRRIQAQGLWIYGQFAWRRNGHLAVGNAKRRYPPRRPLPTDPQTPKSKILFLSGVQGQKLLAQNQTRMVTCVPRQGYPELRVGFRPAFPGQTTAPDQLANVLDPPRRNARSQRPHRPRVAPRFHPSPPR